MDYKEFLNNDLQIITSEEENHLAAFKIWIEQQQKLKCRMEDQFLIQFLRYCNYNQEQTHDRLELFYTLKTKYPNMFGAYEVDAKKFREVHNMGCIQFMPQPLYNNGPRIFMINYNFNPNKFNVEDIFLPATAMHELLMVYDSNARQHGIVNVIDFTKATASHFMQMTPAFCKKLVAFLEKALPLKVQHVYYINTSTAARTFLKMLLAFVSESLRKRITILGHDMDELTRHIPLEYLPSDYGVFSCSCLQAAKEYNKIWDLYRDYFKENSNFGVTLHPSKPFNFDNLFGKSGSSK